MMRLTPSSSSWRFRRRQLTPSNFHWCISQYSSLSHIFSSHFGLSSTNDCKKEPICTFQRHHHFRPPLVSVTSESAMTNNVPSVKSSLSSSQIIQKFSTSTSKEEKEEEKEKEKERIELKQITPSILHIQFNRPSKLNGLDLKMFHAIKRTLTDLQQQFQSSSNKTRVVIVSGKGRAFCAGLDVVSLLKDWRNWRGNLDSLLIRPSPPSSSSNEHGDRVVEEGNENSKEEARMDEESIAALGNLAQDVAYLWRSLPVPVIAVLHGVCYGGGMQIALGADMRYTTPDCKLSILESKWGLIPDMSISVTLRELIPIDVAKELTMTGRILSGVEAKEMGLVTRCCDDPMEEALTVAKEIISRSPDAVAATKKLYQETWVAKDEQTCLQIETALQKKLLLSWNQLVASGRNFGVNVPYWKQMDMALEEEDIEDKGGLK